jgi:hypothetical protein
MGDLLWLLFIIAVIAAIFNTAVQQFGQDTVIAAIIGLVVLMIAWKVLPKIVRSINYSLADAADDRRRRREAEERARQDHKDQQERLRQLIESSKTGALSAFEAIPKALLEAEALLDKAESEFAEGLFSPFWEAVEQALRRIASASSSMEHMASLARQHATAVQEFEGPKNPFPVDANCSTALVVSKKTEERLRAIVRSAQKNFQFATIYEQRRTSNVLIQGFSTLASAIDGMQSRLENALEGLNGAVRDLERGQTARHAESVRAMATIAKSAEKQRNLIADKHSQEALSQLAMLDNIQRGRKPLDTETGPRPLMS